MSKVQFNFLTKTTLAGRAGLKEFIGLIFKEEKKKLSELSYVFCDDEYILEVNRQFLSHDYYTDIITFDLSENSASAISAEIYISVDTVRSNAVLFHKTFREELHRVVFHGVLHLCGYTDKTKKAQELMREREDYYLLKYFKRRNVPRGNK